MANYGMAKGYLTTGSSAYTRGELVTLASATTVARATSAGANVHGVVKENMDLVKVQTGKAQIGVDLYGIAQVLSGGAISVGDMLANDTTARAVTKTQAGAGVQPGRVFGKALEAATGAGQYINVLLTPGATF